MNIVKKRRLFHTNTDNFFGDTIFFPSMQWKELQMLLFVSIYLKINIKESMATNSLHQVLHVWFGSNLLNQCKVVSKALDRSKRKADCFDTKNSSQHCAIFRHLEFTTESWVTWRVQQHWPGSKTIIITKPPFWLKVVHSYQGELGIKRAILNLLVPIAYKSRHSKQSRTRSGLWSGSTMFTHGKKHQNYQKLFQFKKEQEACVC